MTIAKQEIVKLYNEVKSSVSHAINDISEISLSNAEEQNHILNIKSKLSDISKSFNQDIEGLEKNSEWDRFTIAFFGETNAGKSTIIESLRIIFQEKERQKKIENGEVQLVELEKSFAEFSDILIAELNQKMTEYANEMRNIENQISEIKRENKSKINSALVGVLSLILGVILTMTYQWIM